MNLKTTPSVCSGNMQEKARCEVTQKGQTHNCQTDSITVTSQKWHDRGGGRGFGYVSVKVKKYVCKARSFNTRSTLIHPEYDGRGSMNMSIRNGADKSESFSEQ